MSKVATRLLMRGMQYQEKRLSTITNNMANSTTPGYKTFKPVFDGIVSRLARDEEILSSNGAKNGIQNTCIDFSQGPLIETGGKFDLAIEGNGFFVVNTPEGTLYTRSGQFTISNEKKLVNASGYHVMGSGGEITIYGTQVSVASDGLVTVDGKPVGTVKIVDFKEKESIQPIGNSLFINTIQDNEEIASTGYSIKQGFIESSNVNVMDEFINLINCIRAYGSYDTVKQKISDASSKLNELPRLKT